MTWYLIILTVIIITFYLNLDILSHNYDLVSHIFDCCNYDFFNLHFEIDNHINKSKLSQIY